MLAKSLLECTDTMIENNPLGTDRSTQAPIMVGYTSSTFAETFNSSDSTDMYQANTLSAAEVFRHDKEIFFHYNFMENNFYQTYLRVVDLENQLSIHSRHLISSPPLSRAQMSIEILMAYFTVSLAAYDKAAQILEKFTEKRKEEEDHMYRIKIN